jgi:hypothetical protein
MVPGGERALFLPDAVMPNVTDNLSSSPPFSSVVQVPAADGASTDTAGSLVGVAQYTRDARGPPLAVGHLAVDADKINRSVTKGKAVIVLHTWKDHLWAIGSKSEPPGAVTVSSAVSGQDTAGVGDEKDGGADGGGEVADVPPGEGQEPVADHSVDVKHDGPAAGAEETLTPEGNVPSSRLRM